MQITNFSTLPYKIRTIADKNYIFDIIRKKYVRLTPEEKTRQHFIHYLINHLSYPKSLISIERSIQGKERLDRPDIVTYDREGKPFLIVECKACHISITEIVYSQIARYNRYLQAPLLAITNGQEYGCWKINYDGSLAENLESIPVFGNTQK